MPKIEINGKTINYTDEGSGPVLLMGHSYLWDNRMWDEQIAVLAKHYRCIAPDLWGHGKSSPLSERDYSISDLADDYLLFMNRLGVDEFSLVGLSVGGMWATELALKKPEAVKALILMNTYVGQEPEETKALYFSMLDIVESVGTIPDQMIDNLVPIFLSPLTREKQQHIVQQFREGLRAFTAEQIPTIVRLGRAIFGRRGLLDELGSISAPTLVIAGEDDRPRPVSEARKMADLIKGATLTVIPAAGHITAKEQPEAVSKAIVDFLGNKKNAAF